MIKIPFEQIVAKIKEESKISEAEIQTRIKNKIEKLSGLISKEGAAHIVANELGIKLFEKTTGKLDIKNVLIGMRSVDIDGKVQRVFPMTTFQRKTDGGTGKVSSFIIADPTGTIRTTVWGDKAESVQKLNENDIVRVINAYVKDNNGRPEIHLGTNSELTVNPEGVKIKEVKKQERIRKKIQDLKEGDQDIEILGTIVQVFDIRYYEVCPECSKKLVFKEDNFECSTHGQVQPAFAYVLNLFVDDGSENTRVVLFRNQAERLVGRDADTIISWKDNPARFEDIKTELLGQMVKITGRVSKNAMFDRLEFIAQLVFPNPDPEEELKLLEKEQEPAHEAVSIDDIEEI